MKINLIEVADSLYVKLSQRGVCFTDDGFPVFTSKMIMDDTPKDIVPYNQIRSITNKHDVAVCFFQEDERLYARLNSIEQDISRLKEYMGVCGFDLSPNMAWPVEQQLFNILLSQLYTAYLAVNGVKVIPNWRIGNLNTLKALNSYPKGIQFAVGTLGSVRTDKSFGIQYMKAKILVSDPSRLLIYGKLSYEYSKELMEVGIPYVQYDDIMSKRKIKQRRTHNNGC